MPGRRLLIHRQLWLVALLLPVFAGACGGSGVDREFSIIGGETTEGAEWAGYALVGEDITGGGPTIRVQVGDQVTITLENTHGQYFGDYVPHNFAIFPDKDDRVPGVDEPLWGAATSTLLPGESERITFTPDTPGTYHYVCTVTGHVLRGMWGEFVVEEELTPPGQP